MLSALAVSVQGLPGDGFFTVAQELGGLADGEDRWKFWDAEKDRVYAFDLLGDFRTS